MFCDVWRRRSALQGTRGSGPCLATSPNDQKTDADIKPRSWSQGEWAGDFRNATSPPKVSIRKSRGNPSQHRGVPRCCAFGGRYTDVAVFTHLVQVSCGPDRPEVAVADSATRFLADGELSRLVPHRTRILIASRGPALTCATLAARPAAAPTRSSPASNARAWRSTRRSSTAPRPRWPRWSTGDAPRSRYPGSAAPAPGGGVHRRAGRRA